MLLCACVMSASPITGLTNQFSTDLTTAEQTLADDGAVQSSAGSQVNLPGLPQAADLVAYHLRENGDHLFALNTTAVLPGDVVLAKGDVGLFDGANYSNIWSARAHGLPGGVMTDGVTEIAGKLTLSFDITVKLGDFTANDEDLVSFEGNTPALYLDGTSINIDQAWDLDSITYIDAVGGLLFMSFDTSGKIGEISFNDEDVLLYNPAEQTWRLFFNGTARFANADVDAFHAILEIFTDSFE